MDKSEAIATVDDAIRKLVQLSSKEKVWAQEMLLQVNDQSLRLLDVESQVWQRQGSRGREGSPSRDPDTGWASLRGRDRMRRAKGRRGREDCAADNPGNLVTHSTSPASGSGLSTRCPEAGPGSAPASATAWQSPGLRLRGALAVPTSYVCVHGTQPTGWARESRPRHCLLLKSNPRPWL